MAKKKPILISDGPSNRIVEFELDEENVAILTMYGAIKPHETAKEIYVPVEPWTIDSIKHDLLGVSSKARKVPKRRQRRTAAVA